MSLTQNAILLGLVGTLWCFIHFCCTIFFMNSRSLHKPPPGPPGLPLIGHLHILGKQPHRTLYKLSKKYGPIMSLRLGSIPAIVVSTSAAAELFLKTHDTVFASRPKSQATDYLWYGTRAMIFTEHGTYWRNVRKFWTLELLSSTKIASMARMRREELVLLVKSLKEGAAGREVVNVSQKIGLLMEDMTCRMLFGKSRDDRFDLNAIIHQLTIIVGAFNIADFIPFSRTLDLQVLSITITWIISELLRHPRVMKLLQEEVQSVVGDCELVEESHLSKLDYLDKVVMESMRLHPVSTLLAPHESMEDIVVDGYHIKKKSRIIVNNWGIGRDPSNWSGSADAFHPEICRS